MSAYNITGRGFKKMLTGSIGVQKPTLTLTADVLYPETSYVPLLVPITLGTWMQVEQNVFAYAATQAIPK